MIKTIADALSERGYETLTDVQQAVSEPDLQDADLLVSAQTGSGKTVGFGLAIANTLLEEEENFGRAAEPLALVIAPTRELAMQVKSELGWLYAKAGVRMASCVGGMDSRDERRTLERGAHIVVGTPGRLRDHITKGVLVLDNIRAVVLDEADEMLDMGFREDLEFMLDEAPEERRTLLFSATVPPMIEKLAKRFQRDAVRISTVNKGDQHADISYQALKVHHNEVENAIINLLRFHEAQTSIVFANTRAAVARLMSRFSNRGFRVVSLSGELTQSERSHALQALRDGRANVCVATDVAARGIDLPNLDLVIHAELPTGSEPLLHRSGRTGRAGRKGVSAMLVTPKTLTKARKLLQWAKVNAEWVEPPSAEQILLRDQERLLNDPVWTEEPNEEQAAFATTLLAQQSPERIAAAYWQLYQSQHSAPEDLSTWDEKPERKRHQDFGPSTWFSISIGRKNKAEPRWLLPMLLRGCNLDRTVIGAIRVRQTETFVEVAEAAVENMTAFLDAGGELEEGIRMVKLDEKPDLPDERPAPRPRREGGPKRDGKPRAKRDWEDKPRKPRDQDRGKVKPAPSEAAERPSKPARSVVDEAPKKPRHKKVWDKPKSDDRDDKKPYRKKSEERYDDRPRKPRSDDKPRKPRSFDGPKSKSGGDKPYRKKDKPEGEKPFRKREDKPKGKPGAASASKSFRKPGKKSFGGNDVPRRRK